MPWEGRQPTPVFLPKESLWTKESGRLWFIGSHRFGHNWSDLACTLVKTISSGLPWWSSGQESACQCRGHGFDLYSWKIPFAAGQLSPCATTTQPVQRNYWSLLTPEPMLRESPHAATKPKINTVLKTVSPRKDWEACLSNHESSGVGIQQILT